MSKLKYLVMLLLLLCVATPVTSYCDDLDTLNKQGSSTEQTQESVENSGSSEINDESFNSVTDYMRGHEAVTEEDMASASKMASPITGLIGKIIGLIVLLTNTLIFLVTALDLMYIAVPFTRRFLNPSNLQQGGGMMPGMGMGSRMGMGMSMGGASGGGGADPNAHKWVSDEAVAALLEGGQMQGGGAQMQGGMGMGMGAMGGMGMQQPQQPQSTKSIIGTYLKKRIFFLIVFAIASTLLMSSLFLDCGLNLAELIYKIMNMFNDGISNVEF